MIGKILEQKYRINSNRQEKNLKVILPKKNINLSPKELKKLELKEHQPTPASFSGEQTLKAFTKTNNLTM